jgi:hypothetical protein
MILVAVVGALAATLETVAQEDHQVPDLTEQEAAEAAVVLQTQAKDMAEEALV